MKCMKAAIEWGDLMVVSYKFPYMFIFDTYFYDKINQNCMNHRNPM